MSVNEEKEKKRYENTKLRGRWWCKGTSKKGSENLFYWKVLQLSSSFFCSPYCKLYVAKKVDIIFSIRHFSHLILHTSVYLQEEV